MLDKIKELAGSIRFWIVTLTAILSILQIYSEGDPNLVQLLDIIKVYLMTVVGLGTADSIATKLGSSIGAAIAKK